MKFIDFNEPGGPDVLVINDGPTPSVGDDDVLIKVSAAGVNGPDIMQRKGLYPPPPGASQRTEAFLEKIVMPRSFSSGFESIIRSSTR